MSALFCGPDTTIIRSRVARSAATTLVVRQRVTEIAATTSGVHARVSLVLPGSVTALGRVTHTSISLFVVGNGLVIAVTPTTVAVTRRVGLALLTSFSIDGRIPFYVGTSAEVQRHVVGTSRDSNPDPANYGGAYNTALYAPRFATTFIVAQRVLLPVPTELAATARLTKPVATSAIVIGRPTVVAATNTVTLQRAGMSVLTFANVIDLSGRVHRTHLSTVVVRQRAAKSVATTAAIFYYQHPTAPTLITASRDTTTSTLVVAWTAPGANGTVGMGYGTLAHYNVYATPAGGAATLVGTASTPSFHWTGGTLGTAYTFTVSAVNNEVGEGTRSAASSAVVPALAPAAPTITSPIIQSGSGQLTVSWSASTANGAAVDGYDLWLAADGVNYGELALITGTSFTVGGRTNGSTYTFKVRARNASGVGGAEVFGPFSAPVAQFPAAAPNLVGALTVTPGDSSTGHGNQVTWSAVSFNAGTAPVYNVMRNGAFYDQISAVGSGNGNIQGAGSSFSVGFGLVSYTDHNIANGAAYFYQVYPYGIVNGGYVTPGPSPLSATVIPSGIPPVMAPPVAVARGILTVALSWTPPSPNGATIIGYRLYRSDGAFFDLGPVTSYNDTTALTPGGSYTYVVLAKNTSPVAGYAGLAGWGSPSGSSAVAIPYNVPSTPAAPSVVATGNRGELALSWSAPAANGQPLTGVSLYRLGAGWQLIAYLPGSPPPTTHTDEGLPDSTTVQYAIQYTNAAGQSALSGAGSAQTPGVPGNPGSVDNLWTGMTTNVSWSPSSGATSYIVEGYLHGPPDDPSWADTLRTRQNVGNVTSHSFGDFSTTRFNYVLVYALNAVGQSGGTGAYWHG